jgi:hypothetical protein
MGDDTYCETLGAPPQGVWGTIIGRSAGPLICSYLVNPASSNMLDLKTKPRLHA